MARFFARQKRCTQKCQRGLPSISKPCLCTDHYAGDTRTGLALGLEQVVGLSTTDENFFIGKEVGAIVVAIDKLRCFTSFGHTIINSL